MARKAVALEYGQSINITTDQGVVRVTAEAGARTIVRVTPREQPGSFTTSRVQAVPVGTGAFRELEFRPSTGDPARTFDIVDVSLVAERRIPRP